nr:lysozyme inhibitor LprI family protein [Herbaspirillum sp. ASV7]
MFSSQQVLASPDDSPYGDCEDVLPIGSANHSGCLAQQERKKYWKLQRDAYERLVKALSTKPKTPDALQMNERVFDAFTNVQSAWEKYYPEACELSGSLTMAANPWQSTYAVQCEAVQLQDRLEKLNKALICFEKIPEDTRAVEGAECLNEFGLPFQ